MSMNARALAISFVAGVVLSGVQHASAQNNPPPATASRPAEKGPDQTSLPNNAPPATRTQTTGQTSQDPTVKEMNERERSKVEREGK